MEKAPSNIIVSDRQASTDNHLICSPNAKTPENQQPDHDMMCYDHVTGFVIGDSSTSFGLTRGGRPIKPTQKFKDMEWHTVGGRGKRGPRSSEIPDANSEEYFVGTSEDWTIGNFLGIYRGSPPSVYSEELSDDLVVLGVSSEIQFLGIPSEISEGFPRKNEFPRSYFR
ncbi:hypothetical protein F2Q70_00020846 [Brassica cretica]|uniref:Uncharacterized protein n=1 Tax=Brassica cretica TaxID=69181 RepID=A0A8S9GM15_BRACR|nr:hypothetical protein F2Q70_00020846 [Brassica cretica]